MFRWRSYAYREPHNRARARLHARSALAAKQQQRTRQSIVDHKRGVEFTRDGDALFHQYGTLQDRVARETQRRRTRRDSSRASAT